MYTRVCGGDGDDDEEELLANPSPSLALEDTSQSILSAQH